MDEVARFEEVHHVGTKAAFALMLYTGMRISDLCQVGRQHVRDEWLIKPQHKNRRRQGKIIEVPILPILRDVLDASPLGDLTFLVTDYGRPFSIKGIGGRVKDWCKQAGLDHCQHTGCAKQVQRGPRRTVPQRHSSRRLTAGGLAGGGDLHGQDGARKWPRRRCRF